MNKYHELREVLWELKSKERESGDADVIRLIDTALELVELTTQDRDAGENVTKLLKVICDIVLRLPALAAFIERFIDDE